MVGQLFASTLEGVDIGRRGCERFSNANIFVLQDGVMRSQLLSEYESLLSRQ